MIFNLATNHDLHEATQVVALRLCGFNFTLEDQLLNRIRNIVNSRRKRSDCQ